jgi:hypothetical protein
MAPTVRHVHRLKTRAPLHIEVFTRIEPEDKAVDLAA